MPRNAAGIDRGDAAIRPAVGVGAVISAGDRASSSGAREPAAPTPNRHGRTHSTRGDRRTRGRDRRPRAHELDRRRPRVGEPRGRRGRGRGRAARRSSSDAARSWRSNGSRSAAIRCRGSPRAWRWRGWVGGVVIGAAFVAGAAADAHRRRAPDQRAAFAGASAARVEPRRVRRARRRLRRPLRRAERARPVAAGRRVDRRRDPPRPRHRRVGHRSRRPCAGRLRGRLDGARDAALRGARRAHPACGGRRAGARRHRGPLRARPRVRVPRDVGEHVPRRADGAGDPRHRVLAGCAPFRAGGTRRRADRCNPRAGKRERRAVAASHVAPRSRRS